MLADALKFFAPLKRPLPGRPFDYHPCAVKVEAAHGPYGAISLAPHGVVNHESVAHADPPNNASAFAGSIPSAKACMRTRSRRI